MIAELATEPKWVSSERVQELLGKNQRWVSERFLKGDIVGRKLGEHRSARVEYELASVLKFKRTMLAVPSQEEIDQARNVWVASSTAAKILVRPSKHVYRLARRGQIKSRKDGNSQRSPVWFEKASILEYLRRTAISSQDVPAKASIVKKATTSVAKSGNSKSDDSVYAIHKIRSLVDEYNKKKISSEEFLESISRALK